MSTQYLAVPNGLSLWLSKIPNATEVLSKAILDAANSTVLRNAVHASDTFRATASKDGQLLVLWNTDYLDVTGGNSWGFISLDEDCGASRFPEIAENSIGRALKVVEARLARKNLPAHYRFRSHDANYKTCTAGGPNPAAQHSLAFWDGETLVETSRRFSVLVVGPDEGPIGHSVTKTQEKAIDYCRQRCSELAKLIAIADLTVQTATTKSACVLETFDAFESLICPRQPGPLGPQAPVEPLPSLVPIEDVSVYTSQTLTYEDWVRSGSPLTREQRQILESDVITRQPLRISGPAGSGKTLLMQLLCIRQLEVAATRKQRCHCLYVCHNSSMRHSVALRFEQLGASEYLLAEHEQKLIVETLAEYCSRVLQISQNDVVDSDAAETKVVQFEIVKEAILVRLKDIDMSTPQMPLISEIAKRPGLVDILVELTVHEIGISIKAHGLTHDKGKYVESEVPFSRLHANLTQEERRFVYEVFEDYYRQTTEEQAVLDADDLAISLLAKLRTPLWNIRRKTEGVDFLFVDETQLFNENERRIFAYLTKVAQHSTHLPIALALDEAQELKGAVSSGFGILGIESIANEHLENVYRCTPSILRLAFFVIQHTTDLFGLDFPDFTSDAKSLVPDDHPMARPPRLRVGGTSGAGGLANYIAKRANSLRGANLRSVCIVVHADKYWNDAVAAIEKMTGRQPYVLKRRGDIFGVDRPGIVMARPELVGGQEFDAVLSVGLEEGTVPPNVEQESFAESLRQRALREIYLVFTRARFRLEVVISVNSSPSSILQPAIANGLLKIAHGRESRA